MGCSVGLNSPHILSTELVLTEHAMREMFLPFWYLDIPHNSIGSLEDPVKWQLVYNKILEFLGEQLEFSLNFCATG